MTQKLLLVGGIGVLSNGLLSLARRTSGLGTRLKIVDLWHSFRGNMVLSVVHLLLGCRLLSLIGFAHRRVLSDSVRIGCGRNLPTSLMTPFTAFNSCVLHVWRRNHISISWGCFDPSNLHRHRLQLGSLCLLEVKGRVLWCLGWHEIVNSSLLLAAQVIC